MERKKGGLPSLDEMLLFDNVLIKRYFKTLPSFIFTVFRQALDNLKSFFAQKLNKFCALTGNAHCGFPESLFSLNRLVQRVL